MNSTNPKDGGPAFPQGMRPHIDPSGMSLRDYFAGQALVGNLACQRDGNEYLGSDWHAKAAKDAYILADAMLEARKPKAQ